MLPTLGGQNTLRGYPDFRFHDRDLVAVNVESRWAVSTQVDGAVFLDAGTVDYCVRAAQNFKGCATTRTTMGRHLRAKIVLLTENLLRFAALGASRRAHSGTNFPEL